MQKAEYARLMGIDHEPAFNWWVMHVLEKQDHIILLVLKCILRYLKCSHKFGIKVPISIKDALELDCKNKNTFWADAIAIEMKNVGVAFWILPDGTAAYNGYQKILCHMIFGVKMEDFCRKAGLVAGGHQTKAPVTITYASVVSHETIRLALTIAALNDLEVKVLNVNAYITTPITEKVWTILGLEFGPDTGNKIALVAAIQGCCAFHISSFLLLSSISHTTMVLCFPCTSRL